jgi:hypothetical protein
LAESYEDKEDVVVAKIDATLNELPHTKVRSFPTIKLYKKETNEAVEYNGERKLIKFACLSVFLYICVCLCVVCVYVYVCLSGYLSVCMSVCLNLT